MRLLAIMILALSTNAQAESVFYDLSQGSGGGGGGFVSPATSDLDMDGYDLLNVGELTYGASKAKCTSGADGLVTCTDAAGANGATLDFSGSDEIKILDQAGTSGGDLRLQENSRLYLADDNRDYIYSDGSNIWFVNDNEVKLLIYGSDTMTFVSASTTFQWNNPVQFTINNTKNPSANGNIVGAFAFLARSSTAATRYYSYFKTTIADNTNLSEDSKQAFQVVDGGALTTYLTLDATDSAERVTFGTDIDLHISGDLIHASGASLMFDDTADTLAVRNAAGTGAGDVDLLDSGKYKLGSGDDYWLEYDGTGTQLRLRSTDVDGGGTDGTVYDVQDGTDDITFAGVVTATTGLVLPNGTSLPATCTVGELWHDTDSDDCADTGSGDGALCICKSANTWALISNF